MTSFVKSFLHHSMRHYQQLASGAPVAVGSLPCRIDVAGSGIAVVTDGVFYETNPFCRTALCSLRIDHTFAHSTQHDDAVVNLHCREDAN